MVSKYHLLPLNLPTCLNLAFVNLIPVTEQCLSTARIRPPHCGHRTGAVLSSDKNWHAVLEHCLALLESYDSSTAISAATGGSGVWVTVLGHCQALPYDPVIASVKDLYQMWKIPEQCSEHCLPVLSFSVSFSPESPHWTLVKVTWSLLGTPWENVRSTNTIIKAGGQSLILVCFSISLLENSFYTW